MLEKRFKIHYASRLWNPILRLADMSGAFIRFGIRADFILIDTYSSNAFYFAWFIALLSRLFNRKYIPLLHGGNLTNRLDKNPKLSRSIFGHPYINISPSGYLKEAFSNQGFNVKVIPNFIQIDQYPFQQADKARPFFLWVRSFHRQYNPGLAIEVFRIVLTKHPEAKLCMVGPDKDGSLQECRAQAASLGIPDKVEFTGKLSKTEWIKKAAGYSVFLNTTNFDNTPVSVIEAMALGLPVVSTDVGGLPFLIEHESDGLLVAPRNAQAMVEAIERILSNPELAAKFSATGRKKAETFDVSVVLKLWEEILV